MTLNRRIPLSFAVGCGLILIPAMRLEAQQNANPPAQPAAVDAVEVLLIDRLLVGFAGSLARKDAGQLLAEVFATVAAEPFRYQQFQDAAALSPVLVADLSQMRSLIS